MSDGAKAPTPLPPPAPPEKRFFLPNLVQPEAPLAVRLEAARALLNLYDCLTALQDAEIKLRIAEIRRSATP